MARRRRRGRRPVARARNDREDSDDEWDDTGRGGPWTGKWMVGGRRDVRHGHLARSKEHAAFAACRDANVLAGRRRYCPYAAGGGVGRLRAGLPPWRRARMQTLRAPGSCTRRSVSHGERPHVLLQLGEKSIGLHEHGEVAATGNRHERFERCPYLLEVFSGEGGGRR